METKTSPAPTSVEASAFRVLVLHGPQAEAAGRSAVLAGDRPLTIGRGESAPSLLGLVDPEVSQRHALIACDGEDGQWLLRDLGSRNGTFVGGVRVTSHPLRDGDVLRVGRHLLLWQYLDSDACQRLIASPAPILHKLAGRSHELLRVHQEIRAVAARRLPTLVLGESGVGKELVAEAIHLVAGRGPFVPVNCAALPENLAESELFGHARGAFTGASAESTGLFGLAEGGTLFLDEIGELSPALQAKLLRALATGEVRGVGQQKARHVDLRIVAATNVDLDLAVREGRFRGDLYARFVGSHVLVPPLRKRVEDILELAAVFLGASPPEIAPDAAEALLLYAWPWNVRELEHVLSAAAGEARARGVLSLEMLPAEIQQALASRCRVLAPVPGWDALLGVRRDVAPSAEELRRVFEHFHGNVSRVAAFFACERRQVYRWAEQFSLDILGYRRAPGREHEPPSSQDGDS